MHRLQANGTDKDITINILKKPGFDMNFKENKAIYLQIAESICDEILLGTYAEEERIPSVREYASTMEVNSNTVMRSYDWLQQQEIIFTKRGLGYFVCAGAKEKIEKMRKREFMKNDLPELFRKMDTLGITIDEIRDLYDGFKENKNI